MKFLFIHPNFPGQFKHLAKVLASDQNNEVKFICRFPNQVDIKGVEKIVSKTVKNKNEKGHRYLRIFNDAVYFGQAGWRACKKLKSEGFIPDVIYAHSGWGDSMFVKDIYPDVPYIAYMEFYYHAFGADMDFFPDSKVTNDDVARTRCRNANHLVNLVACDWAISPTKWQASVHPKDFHYKFSVIHEGIDTELIKPLDSKQKEISLGGKKIPAGKEIITYVTRTCEKYRGFEQAMQAIAILQKKRPDDIFVIVGKEGLGYGGKTREAVNYKAKILQKLKLEDHNIFWFDQLPYKEHVKLLQHSSVHIYLTVPFVLSWSLLEAMAAGAAVVSSRTAPVEEVITDGVNGMLADFFSPLEIADQVEFLLENPKIRERICKNARKTIEKHYSWQKIMPDYIKLIKSIAAKKIDSKLQKKLQFKV